MIQQRSGSQVRYVRESSSKRDVRVRAANDWLLCADACRTCSQIRRMTTTLEKRAVNEEKDEEEEVVLFVAWD